MAHRIIVMAFAAVLFLGVNGFAQEAKKVASPSDVPVDQIKKATATQDAATESSAKTDAAKQDAAKQDAAKADTAKADAAKTKATQDADKKDTPKPVAEGTAVEQPPCASKTPSCDTCNTCDPCSRRGRLMERVRSLFSRRCCR